MNIKDVVELDSKVLTYVFSCLLICGTCFLAGRYTAPKPSVDDVCSSEKKKVKSRDVEINRLDGEVARLQSQLESCEDGCQNKLDAQASRKNLECGASRAKDVSRLKAKFKQYKCSRCKTEGYCK